MGINPQYHHNGKIKNHAADNIIAAIVIEPHSRIPYRDNLIIENPDSNTDQFMLATAAYQPDRSRFVVGEPAV